MFNFMLVTKRLLLNIHQVNQFNIKDNLLSLQGQSTGSSVTHRKTTPTFGRTIQLSEQYGTEAGVGGTISYKVVQ